MKKYPLVFIFLIAFFLRVYKLGSYPVGFLWDEAVLGYNAYSVLKTGRDEYGQFLPLIFKSFGDYKPGLYVYLAVPSVLTFGLNEFAVRLPSALLGAMSVVIFYLLIREQQRFSRTDKHLPVGKAGIYTDSLPAISAFFLAISPWHIMFSRGAWELNIMLFEFLTGLYFLTKYLNQKKDAFFLFSFFFFLSTLFTYQSAKFLLPVLLLGFSFFSRKELFQINRKKLCLFGSLVIAVFVVFNLLTVIGGKAGRVKAMSIFSYPRSDEEAGMFLSQDNGDHFIYNLFHGASVFFTRSVLGRYFNHLSGKFLFITGDWSNQRNGVVYQGVMYYIDVLFLIIGLAVLFGRQRKPLENLMIFWLLIAPLPAALTRDIISSVRSFTMVIPLVYITAIGAKEAFLYLRKISRHLRIIFYILYFTSYILLVVRFLDLYFVHDPKITSENRLYGYRQAIEFIQPLVSKKNKVVFADVYGQPYIFYLFYTKYNPAEYQKRAFLIENPWGDVGKVEKLDNIEFRKIYWPDDRANDNFLFIGDEFGLPLTDIVGQENINFLKEIKFLNGKTAFRIVETK